MLDYRDRNQKLLERFTLFSEKIISLAQKLPKTVVNFELSKQFIPSGTSIGANYSEACEAESSKDFVHKMKICKKEARETKYWMCLLKTVEVNISLISMIEKLELESEEYVRIFSAIISKFKH